MSTALIVLFVAPLLACTFYAGWWLRGKFIRKIKQ